MLVIWNTRSTGRLIHSRDGVNQGNPLSMIVYGIEILPLVRYLQVAHQDV